MSNISETLKVCELVTRDPRRAVEVILETIRLVESMDTVLGEMDWHYTLENIKSGDYIAESGTFLEPQVADEENNWANRAGLLAAYRRLVDMVGVRRNFYDTPDRRGYLSHDRPLRPR